MVASRRHVEELGRDVPATRVSQITRANFPSNGFEMGNRRVKSGPEAKFLTETRHIRQAILFTIAVTLIRLVWLAFGPVGMSSDETYYWDWGRHPDWGYFSKPPMIAWLNALVHAAGSGHTFAFKAAATIFTGLATWMLALVADEVFGGRASLRAAIISTATLGMLASAAIFNTDGPLMFAWNCSMWLFFRCWKRGGGWQEYVGLALVLAFGTLSKQMMLVFPLTAVAAMLVAGKGKVSLPRFMGACLVPVAALIPPVLWNAKHQWITLVHTEHHFQSAAFDLGKLGGRVAEFVISQAIILTPLLCVLLVVVMFKTLRAWRADRPSLALLFFSLPGLLVCCAMVLRQQMNPNWPAVFWSGAMALAAGIEIRSWIKWPGLAVTFGAALVAGIMVTSLVLGRVPLINPEKRLWGGWDDAANKVATQAAATGHGGKQLFIVTGHRFATSQMAFHLPGQPAVYFFDNDPEVTSEYDFWKPTAEEMKLPVVVISFGAKELPATLAGSLQNLTKAPAEIAVSGMDKKPTKFQIYGADKLNAWPADP